VVDAYFYELSEHSTTKSIIVFPSSSCHSTILWGSKRDAAFAIVSLPSQFWIKTSGKQQDNDSHENIAPLMSVYAWPRILRASHDPAYFYFGGCITPLRLLTRARFPSCFSVTEKLYSSGGSTMLGNPADAVIRLNFQECSGMFSLVYKL